MSVFSRILYFLMIDFFIFFFFYSLKFGLLSYMAEGLRGVFFHAPLKSKVKDLRVVYTRVSVVVLVQAYFT